MGTALGAPVLPGKGRCAFLQPGGCNNLQGGLGSLPPPSQHPRAGPASAFSLHSTFGVYTVQKGGSSRIEKSPCSSSSQHAEHRPCSQSSPSSCKSLEGTNPWSPRQVRPCRAALQAPKASISKGVKILCQCLEHFCKIIYGRCFFFFNNELNFLLIFNF